VFTFRPRHDFLQYVIQLGRQVIDLQYRPADMLELDFTLTSGALLSDFVFAVVSKDELVTIKDNRWDLVCSFFFLKKFYYHCFWKLSFGLTRSSLDSD